MHLQRRTFLTKAIGAAVVAPSVARAQMAARPVVGFLSSGWREDRQEQVQNFLKGLAVNGYAPDSNIAVEYAWAEDSDERLLSLAAEMVRKRPAVIVASTSTRAAQILKKETSDIPVVFCIGGDPVRNGLVASINRPGGNLTGVSYLTNYLAPKHLEVLRDLTPRLAKVGHLVNPANANAAADAEAMVAAGRLIGSEIVRVDARDDAELTTAFEAMRRQGVDGFVTASDTVFLSKRRLIVELAARHRIAGVYDGREFTSAGGLASYGANRPAAFQPAGAAVAHILKGARPADLPVEQPTALELLINRTAAQGLGLQLSAVLTTRADEILD